MVNAKEITGYELDLDSIGGEIREAVGGLLFVEHGVTPRTIWICQNCQEGYFNTKKEADSCCD